MFSKIRIKEVLCIIFVVLMIELIISGPSVVDIVYLIILLAYFVSYRFSK